MGVTLAQNFYKETITITCSAGATNIYVSTKPTISTGYLVISPNSASLREIIKFTATGTDGSGDYVTVTLANRGLGGTTAQTHAVGETVFMNITAEHIEEVSDALDQIVAGSAQDASTSTKGIVKMSVAPASATEPIAVGDNDPRMLGADTLAALAGDGGTPSSTNPFTLKGKAMTAGETINGAILPVPVYISSADGEVYACDGNDNTKYKFIGFAISNSTDGNAITVQTSGVVTGFTGLTTGSTYFVQDTAGTIGTTQGTHGIQVGVAISATRILIVRPKQSANGVATFSATGTSAVTTGFRPAKVRVYALITSASATFKPFVSSGGWTEGEGNKCVYVSFSSGSGQYIANYDTSRSWYISTNSNNPDFHRGVITTVTDTGFTISNTKQGTTNDVYLYWEAEE